MKLGLEISELPPGVEGQKWHAGAKTHWTDVCQGDQRPEVYSPTGQVWPEKRAQSRSGAGEVRSLELPPEGNRDSQKGFYTGELLGYLG